jgi:hypothetical protein
VGVPGVFNLCCPQKQYNAGRFDFRLQTTESLELSTALLVVNLWDSTWHMNEVLLLLTMGARTTKPTYRHIVERLSICE